MISRTFPGPTTTDTRLRDDAAAAGRHFATIEARQMYMLAFAGAAAIVAYVMRCAQLRAQDQRREECLDTALADTFPASDPLPVSAAQPARSQPWPTDR